MGYSQQLTDSFAIGNVYFNPNSGLLPANPTPQELKTITEITLDYKGKNVELRGQYLVPVDARMADVSITGKFTVGTWNLNQLNQLLFAGTVNTSNVDRINADEPQSVPGPSGPYTVQVANHAGFMEDLGVSYQSNSGQFQKIAGATGPTGLTGPGVYKVDPTTGTYTFSGVTGADASAGVFISYVDDGGVGASLTIPNNLQGQSPQFELVALIPGQTAAGFVGYRFYACRATGMKILTGKNNDFQKVEVDFAVYCPIGANVGELIQTAI